MNASQCPLCGEDNNCQQCSVGIYKGPCWCEGADIPEALLALVPSEQRNTACICRECVTAFHRDRSIGPAPALLPGDFYFERGRMVFAAAYHLRRGYCCGNGCRHCPYPVTT
ncbi:MAG: cysteine-rich CWC family protein [Verrucomicrobiota bacterium]